MSIDYRAERRNESLTAANVDAIRRALVRAFLAALICLAPAWVPSQHVYAGGGGSEQVVASSPEQKDSDPAVDEAAAETEDSALPTSTIAADTETPALPGEATLREQSVDLQGPDPAAQEHELAAAQAAADRGDREALRKYLQDPDVAVQAAAFESLAAQDGDAAVQDLLATVNDTTQTTRLQALELLVQVAATDDQTRMNALRNALEDPDPAFNALAVQELVGRGDAAATGTLQEALHSADPSTRLKVLESLAHVPTGLPFIEEALADPDENVGAAAAALLERAEPADDATAKP